MLAWMDFGDDCLLRPRVMGLADARDAEKRSVRSTNNPAVRNRIRESIDEFAGAIFWEVFWIW